jgi:hypothetical protein
MSKYDVVDIAEKFNKNIKKLLLFMNESLQDNILFDTVKRRVTIITKEHPLLLLEEAGPEIFKYRDPIHNESDDLFDNLDATVMDNEQFKTYMKDNKSQSESINQLLKMLKKIWISYSADEKKQVKKSLKILLSEYCKYLTLKN